MPKVPVDLVPVPLLDGRVHVPPKHHAVHDVLQGRNLVGQAVRCRSHRRFANWPPSILPCVTLLLHSALHLANALHKQGSARPLVPRMRTGARPALCPAAATITEEAAQVGPGPHLLAERAVLPQHVQLPPRHEHGSLRLGQWQLQPRLSAPLHAPAAQHLRVQRRSSVAQAGLGQRTNVGRRPAACSGRQLAVPPVP